MQAKDLHSNPYIYILYYQLKMLYNITPGAACLLFKMIYFICKGVLEQPAS